MDTRLVLARGTRLLACGILLLVGLATILGSGALAPDINPFGGDGSYVIPSTACGTLRVINDAPVAILASVRIYDGSAQLVAQRAGVGPGSMETFSCLDIGGYSVVVTWPGGAESDYNVVVSKDTTTDLHVN